MANTSNNQSCTRLSCADAGAAPLTGETDKAGVGTRSSTERFMLEEVDSMATKLAEHLRKRKLEIGIFSSIEPDGMRIGRFMEKCFKGILASVHYVRRNNGDTKDADYYLGILWELRYRAEYAKKIAVSQGRFASKASKLHQLQEMVEICTRSEHCAHAMSKHV